MKPFRIVFTNRVHFLVYFLMMIDIGVIAASDAPDPEEWYAKSYRSVWLDKPSDKVADMLDFYHSEIIIHEPDGELVTLQTSSWINEAVEEWVAEGWLSSEVPDIRVNRINASTVSFTTRWLDHYKDREDEYSCAWYLADLMDDQWKFTHYAPIDCTVHGF